MASRLSPGPSTPNDFPLLHFGSVPGGPTPESGGLDRPALRHPPRHPMDRAIPARTFREVV